MKQFWYFIGLLTGALDMGLVSAANKLDGDLLFGIISISVAIASLAWLVWVIVENIEAYLRRHLRWE